MCSQEKNFIFFPFFLVFFKTTEFDYFLLDRECLSVKLTALAALFIQLVN